MEWLCGQIVISKQGRDCGNHYVIIRVEDHDCFVADGRKTSFSRPKKKNKKHLQPTNVVSDEVKSVLLSGSAVKDELLRDILNKYCKEAKEEVSNGETGRD